MRILLPLVVLAVVTTAEIRVDFSVEWFVVDSDLVVRGRIVGAKAVAFEKDCVWRRVTFKVEETLKGTAVTTLDFVLDGDAKDERLDAWRKGKIEMVLFLVKSERFGKDAGHLAKTRFALFDQSGYRAILRLEGKKMWSLTDRNGNDYTKRDDMLAAIRRAVRAIAKGPRLKSLSVQHPVVPNDNAIFGPQYVIVPIDAVLEEQARAMLKHKDKAWRIKGIRILRYFKSAANRALLLPLLKDQTTDGLNVRGSWAVLDLEDEFRIYSVRLAAYRVFKRWGEPMARPKIIASLK